MAAEDALTVEQRLTILEGKLRKANERVRDLEEWRRRAGVCVLIFGGLTALLLVLGQVMPATSASSRDVMITKDSPFRVVNQAGKVLLTVEDFQYASGGGSGAVMSLWNQEGYKVLQLGVNQTGLGLIQVKTPDSRERIALTMTDGGSPILQLEDLGQRVVSLSVHGGGNPILEMYNKGGTTVVQLEAGVKEGRGHLVLANAKGDRRVEAGSYPANDHGAVQVFGPSGKCLPAIAGIPCLMQAK